MGKRMSMLLTLGRRLSSWRCSGLMHIVKTLLSIEDLYSNQLRLKLDSKVIGESVMEEYNNYKVLLGESCYKGLKKSGMIKEVA